MAPQRPGIVPSSSRAQNSSHLKRIAETRRSPEFGAIPSSLNRYSIFSMRSASSGSIPAITTTSRWTKFIRARSSSGSTPASSARWKIRPERSRYFSGLVAAARKAGSASLSTAISSAAFCSLPAASMEERNRQRIGTAFSSHSSGKIGFCAISSIRHVRTSRASHSRIVFPRRPYVKTQNSITVSPASAP